MEKPWLLQTIPEGDIIGWKKVKGIIVKLLIPKEAKRCHGIGSRKNRAEFAMVLDVENKSKEILNTEYAELLYKAGQVSTPDSYDGDIKVECSHGINFFFSREEALAY